MAPGIALNPELLQLILGLNRIITYIGYVLLAGTFVFWSLVWPEGRTDRRLVTLAAIGTGLMVVATIGAPLILVSFGDRLVADAVSPVGGTAAIIRLAILVGIAFFLVDLIRSPIIGWWRPMALGAVGVLAWRPGCAGNSVDTTEQRSRTQPPDPTVLHCCGRQRRHPGDHRTYSCACSRRRDGAPIGLSLRAGTARQGPHLRSDAGCGQLRTQVRISSCLCARASARVKTGRKQRREQSGDGHRRRTDNRLPDLVDYIHFGDGGPAALEAWPLNAGAGVPEGIRHDLPLHATSTAEGDVETYVVEQFSRLQGLIS